MVYKEAMKKAQGKKKHISFWDKILKQDIQKQARLVEIAGYVGLAAFLILCAALWTVKIDIAAPGPGGQRQLLQKKSLISIFIEKE